jgi:nicotinamidase-related amidase
MTLTKNTKPALLLIDIQKAFENVAYWGGERNNPQAENNAAQLLNTWRKLHLPVFHAQHCSVNPHSPLHESHLGNGFNDLVKPMPGEMVIRKNVNSAFIGTNLEQLLRDQKITHLVLAGLTTDHCVSTTTRMAGNLGFQTFLAHDATATFCKKGVNGEHFSAELIHQTALASIHEEFATVLSTAQILNLIDGNEFSEQIYH